MNKINKDTYKAIDSFFNEMAIKHNTDKQDIDICCYLDTIKVYKLISNTNFELLEEIDINE